MKFVLVLQICSAVLNTCNEPQKTSASFYDYKTCGVGGYSISKSYMEEMDQDRVNAEEIYIRFGCIKEKGEDV